MWTFTAPVGFLTEGSKENAVPDVLEGIEQELKAIATATVARAEDILDKRFMVVWFRPILQKIAGESTCKARRFSDTVRVSATEYIPSGSLGNCNQKSNP
jgi:hypothetical protein